MSKKEITERLQEVSEQIEAETIAPKKQTQRSEARERRARQKIRGRLLNTYMTLPASYALDWLEEQTGSRAFDLISTAVVVYGTIIDGGLVVPMHTMLAKNELSGGMKREKGRRLSTWLTPQATKVLNRVQEATGVRAYDVVSTAIVIYANILSNPPAPQNAATPAKPKVRTESPTVRDNKAVKIGWCEEFGGKVEGNVCYYDKYEVTLAGTTDVMKRSISLSEIPDNRDEFKKSILGAYDNVYEARRAVGRK